jgi:hypothetical protein
MVMLVYSLANNNTEWEEAEEEALQELLGLVAPEDRERLEWQFRNLCVLGQKERVVEIGKKERVRKQYRALQKLYSRL